MSEAYRAFISYSHADEMWAAWLQRSLERYRVPSRLRAARPGLQRRLYPVFRDREELASSGDLSESIRSALARAEALIVICSPAAAASRWVNEEIRQFRALAPDRPVLCLMVAGNPDNASGDCAFPPMLLRDDSGDALPEPLAADPRDQADGRRGALLKIAAGLLGVGVDTLRQRDQQRRLRVASGVAALASVVAIVTIGLAINAQLAREEAELRRGQAEGLISFMLGDLRSRLQPLGQLDMLDAVGEQAMQYFAELGDRGTAEEVLARAMALRQIGEVRFQRAQLKEALEAFTESRGIAAALHEQYPAQDRYLFELGQAEFWVGYVGWEQNRLDLAAEAMQTYMSHTRTLLERDPANADYRLELAYALANLGAIARQQRDFPRALQYFQDSVVAAELLYEADPENTLLPKTLSEGWSWSGSTLEDLARLADAEAAFEKSLGFASAAYELSGSPLDREQASDVATFLAETHMAQGEVEPALQRYREALAIFKDLVRHDPTNVRWEISLYRTQRKLAELAVAGATTGPDPAELQAVVNKLDALVERDSSAASPRRQLALALRVQALDELAAGRPELAVARAQRARDVLAAGEVDLGTQGTDAALVSETLGLAAAAAGMAGRARAAWQAALQALPEAEVQTLLQKTLHARLAFRLGRTAEVQGVIAELKALGWADPRYPLPAAESGGSLP
jgi:tetratricopeptide (TPR) repeat protein